MSSVLISHINTRVERTKAYNLVDLVILCMGSVIGGADDWVSIARLAQCKQNGWKRWSLFPQ